VHHASSMHTKICSLFGRNVLVSIVTCAGVVQRQNISFPS
jgi:hypothetical protein